jgi:tetratricopeptide (TPR) repeat protein
MKWQAGLEFVIGCFGIYGIGRLAAGQWAMGLGFLFLVTPFVLIAEGFINAVVFERSSWFIVLVQVGVAFFDARHLNAQLKEIYQREAILPLASGSDIVKWSPTDGFRLARTVGRNLTDPSHYTTEEFIAAAEAAVEQHPDEWVVFYTLGDKYQEVGRYADALRVCKRCVELRPNDIRSTYALATAYRLLARAAWSQKEAEMVNSVLKELFGGSDVIDPTLAQRELDQTGLLVETAAAQAMRWFERALMLKPDKQSREQIEWDLKTLYEQFPNLKK